MAMRVPQMGRYVSESAQTKSSSGTRKSSPAMQRARPEVNKTTPAKQRQSGEADIPALLVTGGTIAGAFWAGAKGASVGSAILGPFGAFFGAVIGVGLAVFAGAMVVEAMSGTL